MTLLWIPHLLYRYFAQRLRPIRLTIGIIQPFHRKSSLAEAFRTRWALDWVDRVPLVSVTLNDTQNPQVI